MNPEVEIKVQQLPESSPASLSFTESFRRLLLAGVGVMALTRDDLEEFVKKLVERGEVAQRDAERVLRDLQQRVQQGRPRARNVGDRLEEGFEDLLHYLNIPSKRDIDDLSAQVARLSAKVEELHKQAPESAG